MAATTSFHHHHHHLHRRQNNFDLPILRQPNSLPLKAQSMNWVLKTSLNEERQSQGQDLKLHGLVDFLCSDLQHFFDDRGIDPSIYDDRLRFRDPVTKFDTIGGYLFNIRLLKFFFDPEFVLHSVSQTGPYEITTRWAVEMTSTLLPWKPQFAITGVSIMKINPNSQKFCTLVDHWDSVQDNDYFSLEGFIDIVKQLRIYKTPDLQLPKYHVLKRCAAYEVRKYEPFMVAETKGDKLFGLSDDLNEVVGYIFERNSSMEKITMNIPASIQIVLPSNKGLDKLLPDPTTGEVKLIKVGGGIVAATKFSRKITEELVCDKEKELRFALLKAGLKPQSPSGCMLACYNDPSRSWSFLMRNEVLIWLDGFTLK